MLQVAELLVHCGPEPNAAAWRLIEKLEGTARAQVLDQLATGLSEQEWQQLLARRAVHAAGGAAIAPSPASAAAIATDGAPAAAVDGAQTAAKPALT